MEKSEIPTIQYMKPIQMEPKGFKILQIYNKKMY